MQVPEPRLWDPRPRARAEALHLALARGLRQVGAVGYEQIHAAHPESAVRPWTTINTFDGGCGTTLKVIRLDLDRLDACLSSREGFEQPVIAVQDDPSVIVKVTWIGYRVSARSDFS
jgi:hypothetical protein